MIGLEEFFWKLVEKLKGANQEKLLQSRKIFSRNGAVFEIVITPKLDFLISRTPMKMGSFKLSIAFLEIEIHLLYFRLNNSKFLHHKNLKKKCWTTNWIVLIIFREHLLKNPTTKLINHLPSICQNKSVNNFLLSSINKK